MRLCGIAMKFEINSDHGRVGPVVWYNQKQYTTYRYVKEGNLYVLVKPDGEREGAGICFVGNVCVDLHPLSLWCEMVDLWNRLRGKTETLEEWVESWDD